MRNFLEWFFGVGSEAHYQTYWAWRHYPVAMKHALAVGVIVGMGIAVLFVAVLGARG